jgi:hypothetical protein
LAPPDGNHPSLKPKIASKTMPSQNSGAARSVSTVGMAMPSATLPRFQASHAPTNVPNR